MSLVTMTKWTRFGSQTRCQKSCTNMNLIILWPQGHLPLCPRWCFDPSQQSAPQPDSSWFHGRILASLEQVQFWTWLQKWMPGWVEIGVVQLMLSTFICCLNDFEYNFFLLFSVSSLGFNFNLLNPARCSVPIWASCFTTCSLKSTHPTSSMPPTLVSSSCVDTNQRWAPSTASFHSEILPVRLRMGVWESLTVSQRFS